MLPTPGTTPRRCRICGCTDEDCTLCVNRTGQPCHWICSTLCSACSLHGQLPWLANVRNATSLQLEAITLWQPWASLLVWGLKGWETRSWAFSRRTLAIHAAAAEPAGCADHLRPLLDAIGWTIQDLPRGAVVGFARFQDARPTSYPPEDLTTLERVQGDYSPKRWMMPTSRPAPVEPMPAVGARKLWRWIVNPQQIRAPQRGPWPEDRSQGDVLYAAIQAAEQIAESQALAARSIAP